MKVTMKSTVFRLVMSSYSIEAHRRLGGTYRFHLQDHVVRFGRTNRRQRETDREETVGL
jgi:hypothetical protein